MGSTGGGTCGSTRTGITIRKDVQLNVDSMPCRGSGMTQIPLLPFVRGEGWKQHAAVKSHLGKAEFRQQAFNTEVHGTASGHLAALILWQIFFVSCLCSCHCHLQYIYTSEAFLFNATT